MLLIPKWKPISQCKRTQKIKKNKWKLTSKEAAETLHSIAKFPKTQKSGPGSLLWFSICGYIQGDPKLYWEKPTTAYQVNWPKGFVFLKRSHCSSVKLMFGKKSATEVFRKLSIRDHAWFQRLYNLRTKFLYWYPYSQSCKFAQLRILQENVNRSLEGWDDKKISYYQDFNSTKI